MKKDSTLATCQDISLSRLLYPNLQEMRTPRRYILRFFERWSIILGWITLSIPVFILLISSLIEKLTSLNRTKLSFTIVWLVISLVYIIGSIRMKKNIYSDLPWYLKFFDKKYYYVHILISLVLAILINMYSTGWITKWTWFFYLFPPLLASEYGTTTIYFIVTIITIICMGGTEVLIQVNIGNFFRSIPLLNFFIQGALILLSTATRHYYVRRGRFWAERCQFMQDSISRLTSFQYDDGDNSSEGLEDWIAAQIGKKLGFDKVCILFVNEAGKDLELAGGYGFDRARYSKIQFNRESGICGHVTMTKIPHLAVDTNKCHHYITFDGFQDSLSELATPIIVKNKVVGVLDIQSNRIDAFSDEDIKVAISLAGIIALKIEHRYSSIPNQNDKELLTTLVHTSSIIHQKGDLEQLFDDFADKLTSQLDVSLVTMYRLAPGTGFPLLPPYKKGEFFERDYLNSKYISRDSILFKLLLDWQPHYFPNSQTDRFLSIQKKDSHDKQDGISERFVKREGVFSTAFIPLGTAAERVAVLFLNYRYQNFFDSSYKLQLQALSSIYAIQMLVVQQRELRDSPLFLGVPDLHAKFGVQFYRLSEQLSSILDNPCDTKEVVRTVKMDLKSIMRDIFTEEIEDPIEDPYGLERRIEKYIRALKQSTERELRFNVNIDPHVFYSGRAVNQAIYAIVCEAMLNGIHHGEANEINVEVAKTPSSISLIIADNGTGFNVDEAKKIYMEKGKDTFRGIKGIFGRLKALEDIFGAEQGEIDSNKNGTKVMARIPLLTEIKDE